MANALAEAAVRKSGSPHIVLFSGGSAARSINIALSRQGATITRIVPAWDSGGSSKALREAFNMLPVGDIRQALMTMAHGEGRAGDVVRIFNARLSETASPEEVREEFDFFASGQHPLLRRMEPGMARAILDCLRLFSKEIGPDFDLRNGSIGNFVLTGAYLANDRNIERAIAIFRRLCGIAGDVWPASDADDIQLSASLNNGERLPRQHQITRMSETQAAAGVADIALAQTGGKSVAANPAALEAVARADLIVFGPGSFYTSILPHLLVDGVAKAVADRAGTPKVFIGNLLEDAETRGRTLADALETFVAFGEREGAHGALVTHVMRNHDIFPFAKMIGRHHTLPTGDLAALWSRRGVVDVTGDFDDAWVRGQHDGEAVASVLLRLAGEMRRRA